MVDPLPASLGVSVKIYKSRILPYICVREAISWIIKFQRHNIILTAPAILIKACLVCTLYYYLALYVYGIYMHSPCIMLIMNLML